MLNNTSKMATKWGIIGAGKISNDFVAAVKSLQDQEHEFVAVAARNLSSAQLFASTHGIPKVYGSYEELAHDSNVEVVYIGIVNSRHFPVGKVMLESGKHVLMEKPMTLNARQTTALIEVAKRNNKFLMEAIWSRFLPSYNCLMDLIKKQEIVGDIVHVQANLGINMAYRERFVTKALGGGTVLDLGIYPLNAVTMIYKGEMPSKIAAVGHLNEDGVDIGMTCSLQYSNNKTASITTSGIAELPCDMVITGTNGRLKIPNSMYAALTIETPDKTYNFPLQESETPTNYPGSNGLKYEAMEVRKCIQNGLLESSIMPMEDSKMMAQIMDEIHRQIGVTYVEEEI
ncbi:hypothetical protein JTE90_011076 [Oedothorax gibbosus]|uniref:Trans-1,2-dihydrobenzene-1,2-diol dehydrogenase n=1 Tax=Oedothorax gibbosus TaxID=931172 RepID=A0AAV6UMJ3_9ARAC|nr:hypothetical protein JTE90_011076 [Oedothorax gibbosus]